MKHNTTEITLIGTNVGKIWMPPVECEKDVEIRFSRNEHEPFRSHWTGLRDALLQATNDGDFQSCRLANATLRVKRVSPITGAIRIRYWDIRGIGNEDCLSLA